MRLRHNRDKSSFGSGLLMFHSSVDNTLKLLLRAFIQTANLILDSGVGDYFTVVMTQHSSNSLRFSE
jgi:hypothetical protein